MANPPENDSLPSSKDDSDKKEDPKYDECIKMPILYYIGRPGAFVDLRFNTREKQIFPNVDLAIKQYNLYNGTSFEFVEFIRLKRALVFVQGPGHGYIYSMTFKAKPPGTPPTTTFKAKILNNTDSVLKFKVLYCKKISPLSKEEEEYLMSPVNDQATGVPLHFWIRMAGEPVDLCFYSMKNELIPIVDVAIKQYNLDNGTSFEFVEFIRVMWKVHIVPIVEDRGRMFSMSFDAKQPGTPSTTIFKAKILETASDFKLLYCRKYQPSTAN